MHNRCRILIFPNRETIVRAMQDSNPQADPYVISVANSTNKSVKLDDGSTTLKNELEVDWFKFQESLGRMGFMGIVDIEGPADGSVAYKSEGLGKKGELLGVIIFGSLALYMFHRFNMLPPQPFFAEVVDDFGAECEGHYFE